MIQETIVKILAGIVIGLMLGGWAAAREKKRFRCRRGCCVNKPARKS